MGISTHTSRVGCDAEQDKKASYNAKDFYSHIPCGMWQRRCFNDVFRHDFYSHIPCGMWRFRRMGLYRYGRISTHTSRVGCDQEVQNLLNSGQIFLLTHPVWDVTLSLEHGCRTKEISTHTSRVGCDKAALELYYDKTISTHTSRVGCDALG